MNRDDIATLFSYNRWAWNRVLTHAAQVSPDQYGALAPVPHGSLRGTLVHGMAAEFLWLQRLQGESPSSMLREVELQAFEDLQKRWKIEGQELDRFVGALTDSDLSRTLNYKTTLGTPHTDVVGHLLAHVVNHGTQHRSEAAVLLTTYSRSPGDLDVTVFLREGRSRI